MKKYILLATATWTKGAEPLRKSAPQPPDDIVSKEFSKIIFAKNDDAAAAAANAELRLFKDSLPEKWEGSLSWNSEPVIGKVILAEVIDFKPAEDLVPPTV